MANSIVYVSDGEHGANVSGYIATLVQGQYGQTVPIEVRNLNNEVVNLTGYSTITGRMRDAQGNVAALVGAISLDGTPSSAPQVNWVIDEDDTGASGFMTVIFTFSNGSSVLKSLPAKLTIHEDPSVNGTLASGLVGVSEARASFLASLTGLTGFITVSSGTPTGVKHNISSDTNPGRNDDSGDGYSAFSLWLNLIDEKAFICLRATQGDALWLEIGDSGISEPV